MIAFWERAFVRTLTGVDSQVIEEVVPLSEHLGAIGMGAAEESYDSPGLWAFVCVDNKLLGAWNMLFNSNLV